MEFFCLHKNKCTGTGSSKSFKIYHFLVGPKNSHALFEFHKPTVYNKNYRFNLPIEKHCSQTITENDSARNISWTIPEANSNQSERQPEDGTTHWQAYCRDSIKLPFSLKCYGLWYGKYEFTPDSNQSSDSIFTFS